MQSVNPNPGLADIENLLYGYYREKLFANHLWELHAVS